MLGNMLTGKGILKVGYRNKKGKGVLRAGYGNKEGKGVLRAGYGNTYSSSNKIWNTEVVSEWTWI